MAFVERKGLLKKFPGKGGWTYAEIPEIAQNPNNPFGWVKVKGSIDNYKIAQYKLMPMGEGRLFLPVKAPIRKAINKSAGDWVHIILELDNSPVKLPTELKECLVNESSQTLQAFQNLSQGQQKRYIDWIYEAKSEESKAQRIIQLLKDLAKAM
jgi:hypothetical protein